MLAFDMDLAVKIGYKEAIVLNGFFVLEERYFGRGNFIYTTYQELQEFLYDGWSISSFRRIVTSLEKQGLIERKRFKRSNGYRLLGRKINLYKK